MSLFKSHGWIIKIIILGIVFLKITLPLPFVGSVPVTEASILSSLTSVITGNYVAADQSENTEDSGLNSQQMPLLEAPSSPIATGSTTPISSVDMQSLVSSGVIDPSSSPIASPTPTPAQSNTLSASQNANNDAITTYKVASGDTVSGIAVKFGISINTVLWANNLRQDSTLKVGQKLIILPISGISYKVKSGDTLQAIALKYKGDVQEIMAYNNMSDDTLKVGDTIVIPDGEISSGSSSSDSKSQSTTSKVVSTVKKVATAALGINIAKADTDSPSSASDLADGYYMRPIKAGVKTQGIHGHNAVDLADSCGTPIYASAAGTVTVSISDGAWNGGYGSYIVISHSNGSQTLYAHLSKNGVSEGDTVSQGQEIGLMGETGEATGCHVHFEIRNGPVNPF